MAAPRTLTIQCRFVATGQATAKPLHLYSYGTSKPKLRPLVPPGK